MVEDGVADLASDPLEAETIEDAAEAIGQGAKCIRVKLAACYGLSLHALGLDAHHRGAAGKLALPLAQTLAAAKVRHDLGEDVTETLGRGRPSIDLAAMQSRSIGDPAPSARQGSRYG